ncbi:MAG: hypothetical protein P4L50_06135 [Anaerolineaceae bacterium]|nr:hypothetical protein [Anaerolineaceae bacterium]
MKIKGVSYNVGRVMAGNWRPVFDAQVIQRELEIIKNDLHCNAVRICGLDIQRLSTAAEMALKLDLQVWLSPEMWDKSRPETLAHIRKAALTAEKLNQKWPGQMVFLVGSELTLFIQGIVPGKNIMQRMGNKSFWKNAKARTHNAPLNAFLPKANQTVRQEFHGPVSYASLLWEAVDWSLFDFVGVDHYRAARIQERYVEMLQPSFAHGKPVVITEFGYRTYQGAEGSTEGMAGDLSDFTLSAPVIFTFITNAVRHSLFGTLLPPPRRRLKKGNFVRDEALQARQLVDQLRVLDGASVEGAFIMTFISPTAPYNEDARKDLDMNSYSLVKSYEHNRHGITLCGHDLRAKGIVQGGGGVLRKALEILWLVMDTKKTFDHEIYQTIGGRLGLQGWWGEGHVRVG